MKILHVTNSLNPAYGGLSTYLRALVPALIDAGHPSAAVSVDAATEPHLRTAAFPCHALGPVRPGYGYSPRLQAWLRDAARRYDAVIIHGLWQHHGLATHRALAASALPPTFVFPHGMLDPWFRRRYPLKHVRKWLYWCLAERRVLRSAAAVLFTCEEERRLARRSFPGASYRERVVAFGTAAPPPATAGQTDAFHAAHPGLRDRPFWLFLARLHPKKGADLLIDAYAELARTLPVLPRLVLAGPGDNEAYGRSLRARAEATCPAGSVVWTGLLEGDAKWGALRAAEAFVLPSHQENFGLAIVEALAAGTPVLVSDQVNIWRELVSDRAALAAPDTPAGTLDLLVRWCALPPPAREEMRAAALRTFRERYEIGAVARHLVTALGEFVPAPLSP